MCIYAHMEVRDNSVESIFSFYLHMDSENPTQVSRLVGCPSFIPVAVDKHPDKRSLKEEGGFQLTTAGYSPSLRSGRELKQGTEATGPITTTVNGRE